MKFLASIFISALMIFGLGGCGGRLNNTELIAHNGSATVALVYYDTDNDREDSDVRVYCSAVWIDKTHILTADHCVLAMQEMAQDKQDKKEANRLPCEGIAAILGLCDPDEVFKHKVIELEGLSIHYVQRLEAESPGEEPTAWHLSKVVGTDDKHDLALLEAVGGAIPGHESARLAEKVPELGERVHAVGHPKGLYWTFLEGTVAGYRKTIFGIDTEGPFLQVQSPIYFGNSGGGCFNDYGELVGIADFLYKVPSEGFYIPVVSIRNFLKENGIK